MIQRLKRQFRKLAEIQKELQRDRSGANTEDQRQLLEVILTEIREQQVLYVKNRAVIYLYIQLNLCCIESVKPVLH